MKPPSYPLSWPHGYARAKYRTESRFRKPNEQSAPGSYRGPRRHTIAEAIRFLSDELDRLGSRSVVLSSNLHLKIDGTPRGQQSQPHDTGACVYFDLDGKPYALPCDKWIHVECNIYAIGKHIEALRGQNRWGVGSITQAFTGYLALEAQTKPKWFEVLGVSENCTRAEANKGRLALLSKYHPDIKETADVAKFGEVGEAFRVACELKGGDWK